MPYQRIVQRMPLETLWSETGPLAAEKGSLLTASDIQSLLRAEPLRFVVANVGDPLLWVKEADFWMFWKQEAKPHLYDTERPFLENYPDAYFYFAYRWRLETGETVIVLEKQH